MQKRLNNSELEKIKAFDLREYAKQYGYVIEGKESPNSTTMQGTYGKIIIKFDNSDNHWVFFPVLGGQSGSIVDFYMFHSGEANVGKAIGALKQEFLNHGHKATFQEKPLKKKIKRDQTRLNIAFAETKPIENHKWLSGERAVEKKFLVIQGF